MHILIIPSWYPSAQNKLNGIFFQEQAKAIAKHNPTYKVGVVSATFVSIKNAIQSKIFSYGIESTSDANFTELIYNFPAIPKNNRLNRFIALHFAKKLLLKYIEEQGIPDIIHLHSFNMGELVLWAKKEYNIPFVYTEHASAFYNNNLSIRENKTVQEILNNASKAFGVSNQISEYLSKTYNANVTMLPNFIDTEYFNCLNCKKYTEFTFINIAGLSKNKNHTLLLEVFRKINLKYPGVRLNIYGDGPLKSDLLNLRNKLNLDESVKFGGQIDRLKVKEELCRSHCFILTSKVETFGVVAIEAMSCGIPVISTKNGGAESIVTSSTVGVLCEQNDTEIYLTMEKIYLEYQAYDKKSIRQYVIDNFSDDAIVDRLVSFYDSVAKKVL